MLSLPRSIVCSKAIRFRTGTANFSSVSERVKTRNVDGICYVTLSRPDKMNALDLPMFEAIAETAAKLRSNKSLRAIIIHGDGKAFCSGLDVKSMMKNNPKKKVERLLERPSGYGGQDGSKIGNLAQDVAYLWRDLPVPVICALHGVCFGGGLQIALGADFRFATPECCISIMEAKWGLVPDMSGSITIRELIPIDIAKELTMTGRVINGVQAAEIGLVTRCVEDPMAEAERVAKEIIQRSPDSVAASKNLFQSTWVASEEYCLRVETDLQRTLLASWNQIAASGRTFGLKIPYFRRKSG